VAGIAVTGGGVRASKSEPERMIAEAYGQRFWRPQCRSYKSAIRRRDGDGVNKPWVTGESVEDKP